MMEPSKRVKNCINWIISRFPFFGGILVNLDLQEDLKIDTACTNGKNLRYDPAFINSLSREHLIFLVLHETAHIFLKHHLRMQGKNPDLWNQAADYAVNAWLINQQFKPIPEILYKKEYENFSAEKIYNLLNQQQDKTEKEKQQEKEQSENLGKIESFSNNQEETKQEENKIDSQMQQGGILQKLAGTDSGFLQDWIKQQREPRLNIREILQAVASNVCKNDFSWSKPNFRYSDIGYFPSLHNFELGKIAIFCDASGSIDLQLFNQLISETIEAKSQGLNFDLFMFDTGVYQEIRDFQGDEKIQISGGGTRFNCIPEHLEKIQENYAAVIIFTDGYSYIDSLVENCCWIIYDNPSFICTFGSIFHVSG